MNIDYFLINLFIKKIHYLTQTKLNLHATISTNALKTIIQHTQNIINQMQKRTIHHTTDSNAQTPTKQQRP